MNENVPVTFIVINNLEYNVLKNFMRSQPDYNSTRTGKFIAMDLIDPAIDFLALAKSMGMKAQKITKATDIQALVAAGITCSEPNMIEIVVSAEH